jgi:shikimate kinase
MPVRAVLIGLPGAGKSSVGARLSRRWQVPFADSDHLVEARAGRRIAEIFADSGEAAFRELEATVIIEALASSDGVLALGGGAVTTDSVRDALARCGAPVVLLSADRDELLRRVGRTGHRPLLADDPAAQLARLEQQRAELYRAVATVELETAGMTLAAVTAALAERMAG